MDDGQVDRSTAPAPAGTFFKITIYNPHNLSLARQLALFLLSDMTGESWKEILMGRTPQVECLEELPGDMLDAHDDVVIVGLDEFCSPKTLFREARLAFSEDTVILAHLAIPMDEAELFALGARGSFGGFDLKTLSELIKSAAKIEDVNVAEVLVDTE